MDIEEQWSRIHLFETYQVSDLGRVRNRRTHHVLVPYINGNGHVQVGMCKDNRQYKRGVALLVATHFLEPPRQKTFDTPINLDGDTTNNAAYNLTWRPRWFCYKYKRQFHDLRRPYKDPIIDIDSGEVFDSPWDAATKYGLIETQISIAIHYGDRVFPTGQRFQKT